MALAATHPLLDLELRVTRDETWLGARGRLNMEQLRRHLGEAQPTLFLTSFNARGAPGFTRSKDATCGSWHRKEQGHLY